MAFIKKEELKKLQQQIKELKYYQELYDNERKRDRISQLNREIERMDREHSEILGEVNEQHRNEMDSLKRSQELVVRDLNKRIADYKYDLNNTREEKQYFEKEVRVYLEERDEFREQQRRFEAEKAEFETDKAIFEASEKALGKFETALKKAKDDANAREDDARNAGYKNGYADGLADGLRKGTDVNVHKDSKELLEKVVLLSLAKEHGDTFKDEIAHTLKDNIGEILVAKVSNSNESKKSK